MRGSDLLDNFFGSMLGLNALRILVLLRSEEYCPVSPSQDLNLLAWNQLILFSFCSILDCSTEGQASSGISKLSKPPSCSLSVRQWIRKRPAKCMHEILRIDAIPQCHSVFYKSQRTMQPHQTNKKASKSQVSNVIIPHQCQCRSH